MIPRNPIPALLALCLFTTPAGATISYDANGSSTFTLLSDGGMFISATPGMELPTSTVFGTGIALIDADVQTGGGPLTPGSVLSQTSEVSGSAGAPSGFSSATVMNGFLITLENTSTADAIATFEFSYTWDVDLTKSDAADALREAGTASAFFHLTGFAPSGDETLMIDDGLGGGPMSVGEWLVHPGVDVDFSDPAGSSTTIGSASVLALVTVPAGHIEAFSVITDAFGTVGHLPVPEPEILLTLGLGMLGFGGLRRRVVRS